VKAEKYLAYHSCTEKQSSLQKEESNHEEQSIQHHNKNTMPMTSVLGFWQ
jgi:hypothetical protein